MAYIQSITTTDSQTYDIKSKVTAAIPYGECDSTSTATAFTATVDGITALYDGVCVMLKNGVVTSAANFTININNLGAKPCYNNMATGNPITPTVPTRDTTIFNINYTMLLVYSTEIVSGGGWICYRGYDGNTNTIGYQLRTNSSNLVAADTGYRYRIWLTSADGTKWVPINTSTSTDATTARTLNTRAIDPFGAIVYRATNGTCNSGAGIGATGIWQQYTLTIGYSYVKTLTYPAPVYLKCTPQTDGSAVMADIVQALPSSNDGKIYIFLGVAYSATAMELHADHPVYWHDGTGIRLWTGSSSGGGSTVSVTQIQTTGTKIATITVDSVGTDLYAPASTQPTAMTEQEVADAVDAGWVTTYTLSSALAQGAYHFYDSFNSSTNTHGAEITEAEAGSIVYFQCEAIYSSSMYTCNIKDESGTTTFSTGTYIKTVGTVAYFSFTMPSANVKVYIDGGTPPKP